MGKMLTKQDERITMDKSAIDCISEWTAGALAEAEVNHKDVIRIRLAIEDVLFLWLQRLGEGVKCTFRSGTRLRRHYIEIRVKGEKISPGELTDESGDYGEFLYSSLIAQAGLSFAYSYKDGENVITLNPPRKVRVGQVGQILIGIGAAVVFGLLSRLLPESARTVINGIADPLFQTMMGALRALSSPMIFFAICWGIVGIGDISALGKIGRKVIGRMLIFTGIVELLTGIVVMVTGLFSFGDTFEAGGGGAFSQIYQMILDTVPSDIVSPFLDGNALQIIFLGACVGVALLVLGEKVSGVMAVVDQLNGVIQFLMGAIGKIIPLFVFFSVFSMISSDSLEDLGGAVKCVPLVLVGTVLCALVYALAVSIRLRVPFSLLIKKLFPTYLIGLTTASSASAYGTNMETCEKKLGISGKIYQFAIPLGQVIFMPGAGMGFFITAMCMAENSGVSITIPWLIINMIVCGLLSMAAPPVPGGSMACYTIIFTQLGIPLEVLPIAIAVNLLLEFPMTASNLSCLQSEMTLAASKLDMLDYEILRGGSYASEK